MTESRCEDNQIQGGGSGRGVINAGTSLTGPSVARDNGKP